MEKQLKTLLLCTLGVVAVSSVKAQQTEPVNYVKYPDYRPAVMTASDSAYVAEVREKLKMQRAKGKQTRPSHWNNANTKHFPAVFNQDGGSCGSASRIGYMFTHEINSLRDADAAFDENVYPTHFTWLLTNQRSGKEIMARDNGIPNSIVYGGKTYSRLFGYQEEIYPDYGWMQGYDKWYSAMHNRIAQSRNIMSVETEEGRELLKNWLWNHFGDEDFASGGIAGIGVASACSQKDIPATAANQAAGVTGLKYVSTWGVQVDHALTIVGYDDRIEFDLNDNGIYGEESADEKGAWIIVNSWGNGWANQGFIYCPYKHARTSTSATGVWGGWYSPELYHARKDYRPLRTLKIEMEYSHRSEICLSAGVSEDLNATQPEKSILFEHFRNAGDADGNPEDAATPMLGKWLDGVHYEPMEFGYDLTDLSAKVNTRKPLKYFFIIDTKSAAMGGGKIHNCALMDYEFDPNGIETPFEIDKEGMEITSAGNRTIITMIVPGEPIHAPRNLNLRKENGTNSLVWSAPSKSPYTLTGYKIYKQGQLIHTAPASSTEYELANPEFTSYSVTALYSKGTDAYESQQSNSVMFSPQLDENVVRTFNQSGFIIPNVFAEMRSDMTIEFRTNPQEVISWNYHMGPGWGTYLFHATGSKNLVSGWSTGAERVTTPNNTFVPGEWQHVAVVVKNRTMKIFINGVEQISGTSANNSGLGGIGSFSVGRNSREGISGEMDEFRVWDEARTPEQIQRYMNLSISMPESESRLLAYYPMDVIEVDGVLKLRDAKNGNHATFLNTNHSEKVDNSLLETPELSVDFTLPNEPIYATQEIKLTNQSGPGAVRYRWILPQASEEELTVVNPVVSYATAGTYNVTLEAYDDAGVKKEMTRQLVVTTGLKPQASFDLTATHVTVGERVSFVNKSNAIGASYLWNMPGAEKESATTANAAASYPKEGVYNVTLEVTNSLGTDQITQQIIVEKRAPVAAFSIQPGIVLKNTPFVLNDQSKYDPDAWKWILESNTKLFEISGQQPTLQIKSPGRYRVRLETSNEKGSSDIEQADALIVCNADAGQGLNFDGKDDQVKITGPFQANAPQSFTIEWWMNARKSATYSHQMGDSEATILMKCNANGAMTFTMSNQSVSTGSGFIKEREWAHYAVVYTNNKVSFYRNGQEIAINKALNVTPVAWNNGFTLGGSLYPLAAQVDEFRIWNQPRTLAQLRETANNPIEDIEAAKTAGLMVYYQFNQSSGDVVDITGNNYTGVRTNFGPDGDAWSVAQGVFSLDLDQNEDITTQYLKNVTRPFRFIPGSFVNGTSRFQTLETETDLSPWIMREYATANNKSTCFHVDANKGNALTVTSGWDGFGNLSNHKLYQTISLPAGAYVLRVTPFAEFAASGSYLVVAPEAGLPNTNQLADEAIAYATLSGKEVAFSLKEPTTLSLGILINMSGNNCLTLDNIKLLQKSYTQLEDLTNAIDSPSANTPSVLKLLPGNNELTVYSPSKERIIINTITGIQLVNEVMEGTKTYKLPKGVYVVNGRKVMI